MSWDCRKVCLGALGGSLAALMFLAGCAGAPEQPLYLRIAVSERSVVYLRMQSRELRAAMSVAALPEAKPVLRYSMDEEPRYDIEQPVAVEVASAPRFKIALPIPAGELPAGLTAVRASFLDGLIALTLCRTDNQNVEWRCRTRWLAFRTGLAAADAPAVALPDASKIALAITGVPASGKLGIGLNLAAGKVPLDLARADGKGIPAQVRVTDETGREIVSKRGTLGDFGFRCDGPCWSMRTAKGAYAIEAALDAGPFGGELKADARFVVP